MTPQRPTCLAMLLCDGVLTDRTTGKVTVFGSFEEVRANRYPAQLDKLTVYAEIIDGGGKTPVTVRLVEVVDDEDAGEVSSATVEAGFPGPRLLLRLTLELSPVQLPQQGEYRFILEVAGLPVASRRLIAKLISKPSP